MTTHEKCDDGLFLSHNATCNVSEPAKGVSLGDEIALLEDHIYGFCEDEFAEQVELEAQMRAAGHERYMAGLRNSQERGTEGSTPYGARLLKRTVGEVATRIREWIKESTEGKTGPRRTAVVLCQAMDPTVLAYLTGKGLIDGVSRRRNLQTTALQIAGMVEDEARFTKMANEREGAAAWVAKRLATESRRVYRKALAKRVMKFKGIEWTSWKPTDKLKLGVELIDQFIHATGLFQLELQASDRAAARRSRAGIRKEYIIEPTGETQEWIKEVTAHCDLLASEFWPMLIPPKPWTGVWEGGYYSSVVPKLSLVKFKSAHLGAKAYLQDLGRQGIEDVLSAVNAVQATAWQVNPRVLDVLTACADKLIDVPKSLPKAQDDPMPARPIGVEETDGEGADGKEGTLKFWRKQCAIRKRSNQRLRSKRLQVRKTVYMGWQFCGRERVYFPHTMDFRGRIYPVPAFLTPQGPDYSRGCLRFAYGKPIETEEQAEWLAIHGANCFGVDKVDFAERINWVIDHEADILEVDRDPFGPALDFWRKCDAPFQFLAFCFEWAALQRHGYGYVSQLPVSLDGTCNGLQHYSAALRDEVGGKATNLVPSPKPADIYRIVAEKVTAKVTAMKDLPGETGELARACLEFGIDRKLTKRSVMTLPYGCSLFSVREFVEDAIRDAVSDEPKKALPFQIALSGRETTTVEEGQHLMKRDCIFEASRFLQDILWEAIGETVVKAREAMDWLKSISRKVSDSELPIVWSTPDGFKCQQAYVSTKHRCVKTKIDGRLTELYLKEETLEIDPRKQAQGIAPNWVHSMDACALRVYVNMAVDAGVQDFSMVHDSYGALAADTPVVVNLLRDAFVAIYQEDPLVRLRAELQALLPEGKDALPQSPQRGQLDLDAVKDSLYFFA